MIRQAAPADLDQVVRLGLDFHAASPHSVDPVDPDGWRDFAGRLIDHGGVFVSEGGMIGGFLAPLYFNPAIQYANEAFWWSPDRKGRELKQAFEAWARESGAVGVNYTALANDALPRVDAIYRRSGCVQTEVAYRKRF